MTSIPIPEDFAEMAAKMTERELCSHYHRGHATIAAWKVVAGLPKTVFRHPRSMDVPADFAQVAPTKSIMQLMVHYKVSDSPIRRWSRITGVRPKSGVRRHSIRHPLVPPRRDLDVSHAGLAAEYLRRQGPVYRASVLSSAERKRLGAAADDYVLFGRVTRPDDLIAFAEKRGFRPNGSAAISANPSQSMEQSHV